MDPDGGFAVRYRQPLSFERSLGAADYTSAGVKALTGGLGGIFKAGIQLGSGKDRMDVPVAVTRNGDGRLVTRGKQHLLAFDPEEEKVRWSAYFPAPGASGFEIATMTALTLFQAYGYAAQASAGGMSVSSAVSARDRAYGGLDKLIARRFKATKATTAHAYVLTTLEEDGRKGAGILGVNLMDGRPAGQFLFDDKEPVYAVDEVTGQLYYFKKKKILQVYALQ